MPVLKQETSSLLQPWTLARARGTSTVRQELDTPGKKQQALDVLGCAQLAGDGPGPTGSLLTEHPAPSRCHPSTVLEGRLG